MPVRGNSSYPDETLRRFLDETEDAGVNVNDKERQFMMTNKDLLEFTEGQQLWISRMIQKYGAQFGFIP